MQTIVPPEKIGKYKVVDQIGRGAMGVVYKCLDPYIEREVAIKTIGSINQASSKESLQRLRQEAKAAGTLNHPNIVTIYDFGIEADLAFVVMSYEEGRDLKEHFKDKTRFNLGQVLHIFRQLLDALSYAHAHSIIHRDIKPGNIIVKKKNKVVVADFGIARLENSDLTVAGSQMGTPNYMSPEQCTGKTVDGRSDLFSCGVLLYQFLTGIKPFAANSYASTINKVLNSTPPAPSKICPELPTELDEVVMKCLEKSPDNRFQTADELYDRLNELELNTELIPLPAAQPEEPLHDSSQETVVLQREEDDPQGGTVYIRDTGQEETRYEPGDAEGTVYIPEGSSSTIAGNSHSPGPAAPPPGIRRYVKYILPLVCIGILIVAYSLLKDLPPQETAEQAVQEEDSTVTTARTPTKKVKKAPTGQLAVTTVPAGATISWNAGEEQTTTPCQLELPSDIYTFHLSHDGYEELDIVVQIDESGTLPLDITLPRSN